TSASAAPWTSKSLILNTRRKTHRTIDLVHFEAHNVVMKVNIHDAKTHFSTYIAKLQAGGEPIIICNRNEPVAELRAISAKPKEPRPLGFAKGEFEIPD